MRKWLLGVTAVGLGLLAVAAEGRLGAADGATPDISTIMRKVNGKGGLHKGLKGEIDVASPKWDDIAKKTKEYSELAAALGKNAPPKGEKASWDRLTKTYATNAKDLHAAAEKKDKAAALAAHGKNSKMCSACHGAHRED
jgi:hypothetical protein